MRKVVVVLTLLFTPWALTSQELNCSVQVLSPQIQGTTDKVIFDALQKSIYEFVNNTKWTKETFQPSEKIECSFLINITEKLSVDEFRATIQVTSRRPVYKSSYPTPLFNYIDQDFQFKYIESQSLDYSEATFVSNLTSVLSYYVYVVIGLDYDSFSLNGGTPYFQKAQTIVNNAQNAQEKGWKAYEGTRNRYWFTENMLSPAFSPMRECMYKFHRLGLDIMHTTKEPGRQAIAESLELLRKVHQVKPLSFNMQLFFEAKSAEIINIFSQSFNDEKTKVVNLLDEIDPANSNKYQKILATGN